MKRKSAVSGAMIVAASLSATPDPASGTPPPADEERVKLTEAGLSLDLIGLDEDILQLGGLAQETEWFGGDDDTDEFGREDDEYYLAQTIYGGLSGDRSLGGGKLAIPGAKPLVVINPNNNRSMTVLYNKRTKRYFNPKNGKPISPPRWMRKQVEK